MLDYWKIWIKDKVSIESILNNPCIKKHLTINEDGALTGIKGTFKEWQIKTLSPALLQITGSIHKYWNNGTNENDFTFCNAITAIEKFCIDFGIDPSRAFIKNLEYGVNLQLQVNASEIIDQIICFKNKHSQQRQNRLVRKYRES